MKMIPRWLRVLLFISGSVIAAWLLLFLYLVDRGLEHD